MSETITLIKRLRDLGLSQSEISRRTGIPQPRLSRWQSGEVPDAADDSLKLKSLAEQLGGPQPAATADQRRVNLGPNARAVKAGA